MTSNSQQVNSTTGAPFKKRIGIIGGGPAGLACLRVFLQWPEQWSVVAFESRADIGGVWFGGPHEVPKEGIPPSSAIYDSLITNLPHSTMAYHDFRFPPSTDIFPRPSVVLDYFHRYAAHFKLLPHVRLNREVTECLWDGGQWVFKIRNTKDPATDAIEDEEHSFDLAIVANGHFRKPHIPTIPGLDEWKRSGEGRKVLHSAWYREPSQMVDRSVLVIGGGPSGRDILPEIESVAKVTYHSFRSGIRDDSTSVKQRRRISHFDPSGRGSAVYEDGTKDEGIEYVLLATGYELSFTMLPQIKNEPPPEGVDFPGQFYNSGLHVYPLARHIFPIQDAFPITSMAFIGLIAGGSAIPICEAQAVAAARVFSDPSSIDINQEKISILERRQTLVQKSGGRGEAEIARQWHWLPDHEQYEYRRQLYELSGVEKWRVDQRVVDAFMARRDLKAEWRNIVLAGEAADFVKGASTDEDWALVHQKILERAKKRLRL